ncbi:hypothetical protein DFJ74DRAFT_691176 [Hyaloraphidium curvatum]|nr:hypothetical protein DFJ74DRAFT_691176 [Hyaloraphidium curvatum]
MSHLVSAGSLSNARHVARSPPPAPSAAGRHLRWRCCHLGRCQAGRQSAPSRPPISGASFSCRRNADARSSQPPCDRSRVPAASSRGSRRQSSSRAWRSPTPTATASSTSRPRSRCSSPAPFSSRGRSARTSRRSARPRRAQTAASSSRSRAGPPRAHSWFCGCCPRPRTTWPASSTRPPQR